MLHDRHKTWLHERGIESETAEAMEVSTRSDDRGNWLCFPYRLRGQVVNRKYRLTAEKRHEMDKSGKLCLWNADCLRSPQVVQNGQKVIMTEGEFDALIAMQCGYSATVSVPNGAPADRMDDPANSKRYAFLWESLSELEQVGQIILATDGDGPGRTLAHDIASILGPERCWFVTYPEGCKDLNETYLGHGLAGVVGVIEGAKPFPVKGLYRMSDFPDLPPVQGMKTGIACLDDMIEIVPGTLTVVTGYSNMGKTTVIDTIVARALSVGVPVARADFETVPNPTMRDDVARALIGCGKSEFDRHPLRGQALSTIEGYLLIISNALDDDVQLDIEGFLEICRVAVIRDGARIIVLDPWNELEHKRNKDESMGDYIGRAIRLVKAFARRYQVAFWIVAHPTKPQKGTNTAPGLYDVSDSAHWSNKADYGLVYHRPNKAENMGQLATVKIRKGLPGSIAMREVKFDHRNSRIAAFVA